MTKGSPLVTFVDMREEQMILSLAPWRGLPGMCSVACMRLGGERLLTWDKFLLPFLRMPPRALPS